MIASTIMQTEAPTCGYITVNNRTSVTTVSC